MTAERKRRYQYLIGVTLILAVAAFIVAVFSLMSRTDKKDLYLMDTAEQRFGWRYTLLADGEVRDYEPVFAGAYALQMPEGTRAVRITRTMTEQLPRAELAWSSYRTGVEVRLDGELLFSDFPQSAPAADGFLRPTGEDWERIARSQGDMWRRVRMSLPVDYLGRELSMTTYFAEGWTQTQPDYPYLGSEDSAVAEIMVWSTVPMAVTVVCGLLSLLVAAVFLLDIPNGRADGKTLLLCLYFLLLFLDHAYSSDQGYYGLLTRYMDLRFLQGLYVAPLYLYLALRMPRRWRYPLCGCVLAWAVYEGARMFLNVRRGGSAMQGRSGLGALLLFLVMAAAFIVLAVRRGGDIRRRERALYALTAAGVTVVCVSGKLHGRTLREYLAGGLYGTLRAGDYLPVVTLIADIISVMAVIVLVSEVVRRTIRSRQTASVLRERSRLTLEGYERVLRAQEAANAANHETRHHMTALAGLLRDGDVERAQEYIYSVTKTLDRLPTVRYSQNILVDAVAGAYLDQAKAQGIRVECSLKIPAELNAADEDISVFLTNLLENALHACQKLPPEGERYIRLKMALHENFLFIGCDNSAPDEQEAERAGGSDWAARKHGYGLEAMSQIAEKYNSMLLLERKDGAFSVKSNFNLRPATASPSAGPRGR